MGFGTIEVISKNGSNTSSNICYIKNGLRENDYIDYNFKKVVRANGTEEDINCSNKIIQYDGQTTIYNRDGAEMEVSLTNNKAISEVNEDIKNIETKLRTVTTYSTEEQAIGKWIDGKTIYRKVISGNMPVPDINGGTWYNITNNVQDLVNVYGNILQRPYNYVTILRNNAYVSAFDVVVDNNLLKYRNLGIPADQPYKIVIEYMKTTD